MDFFCDQDDIWVESKLSTLNRFIKNADMLYFYIMVDI